ncbi:MAG: glycerol-3-phosphate dehydrogenase/oxidase [bacterium]
MRESGIERLKSGAFDVLILGGGINGAGIARDLSLRARRERVPLSIGLVDKGHFGGGTSGKNSQLIHGGLRYLKMLDIGLVREALDERARLLRLAPGLVAPLEFLMPLRSVFERLYYGFGLTLYDALAGGRNISRHREVSRTVEPGLAPEFRRALQFYDARVHSARFVLANVLDAVRNGAAAANHLRAEAWERTGGGWHVTLRDELSGERFETRARKLIDTTGPWSPVERLRLVRGSHIVLPRLNTSDRAIAWFEPSGRIVFVIPWGEAGDLSLVGTTDVDHEAGPDKVSISEAETAYLLEAVRALFPAARGLEPVSGFSALRGLVREESKTAAGTSREHRIWNSRDGVLHVAGGKYTTYRLMSEQASDLAAREIAPALARVHPTRSEPLGIEAALDGSVAGRIEHAAAHEMARRLSDLMFVSTYWGWERRWDVASLAPYARELGRHLGWDGRREKEEVEAVLCDLPFANR